MGSEGGEEKGIGKDPNQPIVKRIDVHRKLVESSKGIKKNSSLDAEGEKEKLNSKIFSRGSRCPAEASGSKPKTSS